MKSFVSYSSVLLILFTFGCVRQSAAQPPKSETSIVKSEHPLNHLAGSTSPYLLQHSHNPVDWYPWGDEALQRAKKENKPIFLSVGYSACHWCHVMERESFENTEIAALMNASFICVKVDREERPDIDAQYMIAVQMMTGSGGWPMSVFITPDLKPFYGGTYYPPDRFKLLISKMSDLWRDDQKRVLSAGDEAAKRMQAYAEGETVKSEESVPASVVPSAVATLLKQQDKVHGGIGTAPKFPQEPILAFLLDQQRRKPRPELLAMLIKTLDGMANGGIFDQLGGGFHRYSTDEQWLIPHFEKMLYDNAQLARLYFDAYEVTKLPRYKLIAQRTLDFVLREMSDEKTGGFYSSLDADSEGVEGKYYVWTASQILEALGKADGEKFNRIYRVDRTGNFNADASVLSLAAALTSEQEKDLAPLREKLSAVRGKRIRPNTDDKVLTAWNSLMIVALARGYEVTHEERYLKAANRATDFILKTLTSQDGELLRSARVGVPGKVTGFLDDYAFFAQALISLHRATKDPARLSAARGVVERMTRRYWDKDATGGFISPGPRDAPMQKRRDGEDNATPSPNGVAARVLLQLAALPGANRPAAEAAQLRREAAQTVQVFQPQLKRSPTAFPTLLMAWQEGKGK